MVIITSIITTKTHLLRQTSKYRKKDQLAKHQKRPIQKTRQKL
jgi:hypothetical protein